jgi:hypothetical protein
MGPEWLRRYFKFVFIFVFSALLSVVPAALVTGIIYYGSELVSDITRWDLTILTNPDVYPFLFIGTLSLSVPNVIKIIRDILEE